MMAVRGEGLGELGEKSDGIKEKLIDRDNSMVISRGKVGEVEEGKGGINVVGRRLDLGW